MPTLMQAWWLIGLGVIPLIRWLHRRQAPLSVHTVSALFLWRPRVTEDAAGQSPRPPDPAWRRRALLAALLIIALANPHISREVSSITVWVDTSPSMQAVENGETRLVAAELALDQALAGMGDVSIERRLLSDRLPHQLSTEGANWLLTDGANQRVRDWAQALSFDRIIQTGTATSNSSVTQLSVRRALDNTEIFQVLASVSNAGDKVDKRTLSLSENDEILERFELLLEPGETLHFQSRVRSDSTSLTATLNPGDVLRDDDHLTLFIKSLRPLRVDAADNCPRHLHRALNLHPSLQIVPSGNSIELGVTCSTSMADQPDTPSATDPRARIHFIQGAFSPVTSAPVWLPRVGLSGAQQIPIDHLMSADWPGPLEPKQQQVLLLADRMPLIIVSQSNGGDPATVQTVIDFQDDVFAKQAEYVGLVATLVDAAIGRAILDTVNRQSRNIANIVVRPQPVAIHADRSAGQGGNASTSLYEELLLISIFIILLDIVLLLRARHRAGHA
jgi:hypothetical protein